MDLAYVDGNWDDVVDRIAECYREAGLGHIAKFIAYREQMLDSLCFAILFNKFWVLFVLLLLIHKRKSSNMLNLEILIHELMPVLSFNDWHHNRYVFTCPCSVQLATQFFVFGIAQLFGIIMYQVAILLFFRKQPGALASHVRGQAPTTGGLPIQSAHTARSQFAISYLEVCIIYRAPICLNARFNVITKQTITSGLITKEQQYFIEAVIGSSIMVAYKQSGC